MSKKLYVGNLSYSADDNSLVTAFSECGSVESAKVILDRVSGRSKGFAFVEMSTATEAAAVIQKFNGFQLNGRELSVSEAKPKVPRDGRGFGRH